MVSKVRQDALKIVQRVRQLQAEARQNKIVSLAERRAKSANPNLANLSRQSRLTIAGAPTAGCALGEPVDPEEAQHLAREFVRELVDVRLCRQVPGNLYAFDPATEYLFAVICMENLPHIGGTDYVAVSKATGEVRQLGSIGE